MANSSSIRTILLFLIGFTALFLFVWQPARGVLMDFTVYFRAAERYREGLSIYDHIYEATARDGRVFRVYYFYPPFLAWVLAWITPLGFSVSKLLWVLSSFFALAYSSWTLARVLAPSVPHSAVVVPFFLLCFEPVYAGIMEGQVNALILALLVFTADHAQRDAPRRAGFALAVATILKMSPAILLIPLFILRRWRAIGWFGGTLAAAAAGLWFTTPTPIPYRDFFNPFGPLLSGTLERHYVFNFAFDKAILQAFSIDHVTWARWLIRAALPLSFIAISIRLKRRLDNTRARAWEWLALWICCMVLMAPTFWFHHLIWLLIPFTVTASHGSSYPAKSDKQYRFYVILTAIFFLLSQVQQLHLLSFRHMPEALPLTALLPSIATLALVALQLTSMPDRSLDSPSKR